MIKTTIALAALLLLASVPHADKSELCGLMVSIYGVCSPELIDNYLAHAQDKPTPKTVGKWSVPPEQEVKAKLPGTLPPPELAIHYTSNKTTQGTSKPGALKPAIPCWQDVAGCKRCRIDGEQVITCPKAPQWYENKYWLMGVN